MVKSVEFIQGYQNVNIYIHIYNICVLIGYLSNQNAFNFTQSGPGVQCLFANVWYLLVLFCVTKVTKCMDFCFRVLKSKGMSVGDAAAVWFLSVLGSTASAAMPIAPHLRDLILSHTR